MFASHPYINFINITKFVISVEKRKKRKKCTLRKSNEINIASIPRPFFKGFLQVELWLWWSLRGNKMFFDEFVYLWSAEVYICTDVRNSSYLQKCASFTLVPYYILYNHGRALHVRTFVTEFDRPFFLLSWILDAFPCLTQKVTLDD